MKTPRHLRSLAARIRRLNLPARAKAALVWLTLRSRPLVLVILRFLIGIFAGTVTASQTLVASNTPSEKMGFAMGTISSAVGSGNLAGFVLGALVVDHYGYTAGFIASGVMLALAFCFSLGDLGVIALFGTQDFATLPLLMVRALGAYRTNDAAAIAAIMLCLTIAAFIVIPRLSGSSADARA